MTTAFKKFVADHGLGVFILLMAVASGSGAAGLMTKVNADAIQSLDKRVVVVGDKLSGHMQRHTDSGKVIWPAVGAIPEMQREIREIARKQDVVMTTLATTAATLRQIEKHFDNMNGSR